MTPISMSDISMKHFQRNTRLFMLLAMAALLASCGRDPNDTGIEYAPEMYHSIPYEPFTQVEGEYAPFKNKMNQQVPPEGSIAINGDPNYPYYGDTITKDDPRVKAIQNPLPYSEVLAEEGKVLYERFCLQCHGSKGAGDGLVAQHEAINPPKYVNYTDGQVFHVITNGQNIMGSHASQITVEERWKITHYVQDLAGKKRGVEAAEENAEDAEDGEDAEEEEHDDENHDAEEEHDGDDHAEEEGHE